MSESPSTQSFGSLTGIKLPRLRPWRELAIFSMLLMELSWVVPWYRALTPATYAVSSGRAFLVLGGMALAAYLLIRFLNYIRLRPDLRQWVMLALLVASILLGLKLLLFPHESVDFWELVRRPLESFSDFTNLIPDEFLVSVVVLMAWWRGVGLARLKVGPIDVRSNFQLGFFMFLGFILINTLMTGESPGLFIYTYLFGGLMAMGAARVSVLSELRGGGRNPFDRRWLGGILAATTGMLGLSALVVSLAVGEDALFKGLSLLVWGVFILFVLLLATPLILLVIFVLQWIANNTGAIVSESLNNVIRNLQELVSNMAGLAENAFEFLERLGLFRFLDWLLPILKPFTLWIILALIAGIVILIVRLRMRIRLAAELDEDRQWIDRGGLLGLLAQALQDRLRELAENLAGMMNLGQRRRLRAAARIRRIYAELMDLSDELGQPRQAAQTPLEYLPTLEGLFPASHGDLRSITRAYLRVRYGELPETRQEVEAVEVAWRRVREEGERVKDEGGRMKDESGETG